MKARDLVQAFRTFMAEPYQQRWSDDPNAPANSTLLLASMASRDVARETRFFKGRGAIQTKPNIPYYRLDQDKIVAVERVYMMTASGPQQLTSTTKANMGGEQLRFYDQTAAGYTPQWWALPPAPYPVSNVQLGVGWSALPMFPGQRPQYLLDDFPFIGFVPVPTFGYTAILETKIMPTPYASLDDDTLFPIDWQEAVAWYMCKLAYFSDQAEGSDSMAVAAEGRYNAALSKIRSWADNIDEGDTQATQILTHRSFYGGCGAGGDW